MIYILRQKEDVGLDEYDAKIVRAKDAKEARKVANERVGDEGQIWEDSTMVSCRSVNAEGKGKELLGSFNAG